MESQVGLNLPMSLQDLLSKLAWYAPLIYILDMCRLWKWNIVDNLVLRYVGIKWLNFFFFF